MACVWYECNDCKNAYRGSEVLRAGKPIACPNCGCEDYHLEWDEQNDFKVEDANESYIDNYDN